MRWFDNPFFFLHDRRRDLALRHTESAGGVCRSVELQQLLHKRIDDHGARNTRCTFAGGKLQSCKLCRVCSYTFWRWFDGCELSIKLSRLPHRLFFLAPLVVASWRAHCTLQFTWKTLFRCQSPLEWDIYTPVTGRADILDNRKRNDHAS